MSGFPDKGFTNQKVYDYNEYMRQGRLKSLFTKSEFNLLLICWPSIILEDHINKSIINELFTAV